MANEERSVYDVLAEVQHRVTCPKGRVNKFGGYSYRSLEDINAALKPLCKELRCGYVFEDEIVPKRADDGETRRSTRRRARMPSGGTFARRLRSGLLGAERPYRRPHTRGSRSRRRAWTTLR